MKQMLLRLTTTLLAISLPLSASAATITVPGTYSTVAAAITNALDGDIIEIAADTYTTDIEAKISQNNITIRGIGGKAHLNAYGLTISNGKGIFVTSGDNITLENIEFSHTTVRDENGAGIRHEGGLLTLNNCYFHDNENGILTAAQEGGELVVNNSEFEHNGLGRSGYTHNIYVGHIDKFVFNGSYSHHATHGHNIKSRAAENHILYSRIMDEESGNASYQIDLPNGGLSYIIGNLIQQGTNAENQTMISYAAEGASNATQQVFVINNTFVNDRSTGYGIRLTNSPELSLLMNNIFDNVNPVLGDSATTYTHNFETSNSGFVDRASYDYHLLETSAARDAGEDPDNIAYSGSISLTPEYEYLHPLQLQERYQDDTIDIGAHEYVPAIPATKPTTLIPIFPLLLEDKE